MAIKIDKENKIIQKTVTGELHTDRSLALVRELSMAANLYKGYSILMDLRETVTMPAMHDMLAIASACSNMDSDFDSRIAFLIPDTEERVRLAQLFKACMEAKGFRFKQFFDAEAAVNWLSETP